MIGEQQNLLAVLDSAKGLAKIRQYLQEHDWLVTQAFSQAWNLILCQAGFSLTENCSCDFLVLNADSTAWHPTFVVLGPVNQSPFTTGGESKALLAVKRRGESILSYAESNRTALRESLSALLRPTQRSIQNLWMGRGGLAADEILDPQARLEIRLQIVMGRRAMLSQADQVRRANSRVFGGGEPVATYDRFADMARNGDEASRQSEAREDKGGNAGWYHHHHEDRPDQYPAGEIQGTKSELSLYLGAARANDRTLEQKARSGAVWVKRYHRTSFGVWFPTQDAFARANAIQIRLSSNHTQTTENGRLRRQTTV
jgi:hypothetical protein